MNPILPTPHELLLVAPELCLAVGMCAVLFTPFLNKTSRNLAPAAALLFLLLGVFLNIYLLSGEKLGPAGCSPVFSGMLMVDYFSQTFKIILYCTSFLVLWQWLVTNRDHTHQGDQPDFICLILGATFGMSLMASASNLLMIFMAMETASFPSYALAGYRKTKRTGAEASLKYVVFGAAASAIMVYGMSLIYGTVGSLSLSAVAGQIHVHGLSTMLAFGVLALLAGMAFKLSAAPLHFWCPDVFQSAPTAVTTFLSVASKGAAVCLLLRVISAIGVPEAGSKSTFTAIGAAVAVMGVVTALVGTAMAIRQTNIKRLLAFSSIAHAGYMLMAASLIVRPESHGAPNTVASAILFYLVVYAVMNIGAFTIVSFIQNATGAEDLRDYAGLSRRSPFLAGMFTLFLLSLFGMPSLGGFMSKLYVASLMAQAGPGGFALIAVLLLCTVASLYFYMKPVYYMFLVADKENRPCFEIGAAPMFVLFILACALFFTGLLPDMTASCLQDFTVIGSKIYAAAPDAAQTAAAPVAHGLHQP